jgi:signal transduction histidine kinase
MYRYEDKIMDLLQGDTPKQKYENALQITNKIGELQGRIEFLKIQFEWINLNLQQGIGIPKHPIDAILNSFVKNDV